MDGDGVAPAIEPCDLGPSGGRLEESQDGAQQRGFSGTIRAEQSKNLAGSDRQRTILKRMDAPVLFRQLVRFEERIGHTPFQLGRLGTASGGGLFFMGPASLATKRGEGYGIKKGRSAAWTPNPIIPFT